MKPINLAEKPIPQEMASMPSKAPKPEPLYPSLHIESDDDMSKIPDKGTAQVQYHVHSREVVNKPGGKGKTHRMVLKVHKIMHAEAPQPKTPSTEEALDALAAQAGGSAPDTDGE